MPTYYVLDGTEYKPIDLSIIMKDEKLVTDADLQTVKGSSETARARLQTELDETKKRADELLTRALTAESAVDTVKKEYEPFKEKAEKLESLETELNSLREKNSAAETQLLDNRRKAILDKFGIKDDDEKASDIKSMTAEQLDIAEKALALAPVPSNESQQRGNRFDRSPGWGNRVENETSAHEDLVAGMQEIRVGPSEK